MHLERLASRREMRVYKIKNFNKQNTLTNKTPSVLMETVQYHPIV